MTSISVVLSFYEFSRRRSLSETMDAKTIFQPKIWYIYLRVCY